MKFSEYRSGLIPYWMLGLSFGLVVFSSPMPNSPGWPEVLMGTGLTAACIWLSSRIYLGSLFRRDNRATILVLSTLLFVMLPLITGLWSDHRPADIARDFAPMLFLVIIPPVVVLSLQSGQIKQASEILLSSILFVGFISSLHFLVVIQLHYDSIANFVHLTSSALHHGQEELDNRQGFLFAAEPAVLFTAIYSLITAIEKLHASRWIRAIVWLAVSIICIASLLVIASRASVGLYLLAGLIPFVRKAQFSMRSLALNLLLIAIFLLCLVIFAAPIHLLIEKQQAVGGNGKLLEFAAVAAQSSSAVGTLLLGGGWGQLLNNPIYSYEPTRFTHSVISFLLLKTGMIGLAAFLGIYGLLLRIIWSGNTYNSGLIFNKVVLAALPALLIGILFQPSYKMLGYSIILTLLFVSIKAAGSQEIKTDQL